MSKLEIINLPVVSYCEIPEDLCNTSIQITEASWNSYIKYLITKLEDRKKYHHSYNWSLDDWLLESYPELKPGEELLIHIDY